MYRERAGTGPGVRCVWTQSATAGQVQRVVPDGCIDVIWSPAGVFVAGPDTRPWLAHQYAGQLLYGVRFAPGQARLGLPAEQIADAHPFLDQLRPGAAELAERVAEAPDPERELERLVPAVPDPGAAAIAAALCTRADGHRPSVREVAEGLGISERQLHRRCLDRFGYGPKILQRIIRFQRALRTARAGTDFATVAYASGFADQAHLAREVRDLAGVPLGTLVPR